MHEHTVVAHGRRGKGAEMASVLLLHAPMLSMGPVLVVTSSYAQMCKIGQLHCSGDWTFGWGCSTP